MMELVMQHHINLCMIEKVTIGIKAVLGHVELCIILADMKRLSNIVQNQWQTCAKDRDAKPRI